MWDSVINLGGKSDRSEKERKMKEKKKKNILLSVIFLISTDTFQEVYIYAFSRGESFAVCPLHLSVHPELLLQAC